MNAVLEEMRTNPFGGDTKKLKGERNSYRRRLGSWRILFDVVDHTARTIRIQEIVRRTSTTY